MTTQDNQLEGLIRQLNASNKHINLIKSTLVKYQDGKVGLDHLIRAIEGFKIK